MIALDAWASSTSDSLIWPTAWRMMRTATSLVPSLESDSASASTEPSTSPLSTSLSSLVSPWAMREWKSVSEIALAARNSCSRCRAARFDAISRASRSSANEVKMSPAAGTPLQPSTSTGVDGGACFTVWPRSSNIARTRPYCWPAAKACPTSSVPVCTRRLATTPRPCSTRASSTTPRPARVGSALRSSRSADSRIISSSRSIPVPFLAEISTATVLPPYSSTTTPCWASSCFTSSGLAAGRSILLIATTIGTLAARA